MESRVTVPVVAAEDIFTITNPSFMIGGPLQDGLLQLDLADDFMQYREMHVIGEEFGNNGSQGIINPRVEFPGASMIRRVVGRIKLSPAAARQIAQLLLSHADSAEASNNAMMEAAQAAAKP
jgi:hypothetical protein